MRRDGSVAPRRVPFLRVLLYVGAPTLLGFDYGLPRAVRDEDDVEELAAEGVIDDATRDALVAMLYDGVDLNRASRDDLYRLPELSYADVDAILARRAERPFQRPGELVDLLGRATFRAVRPFVTVTSGSAPRWKGRLSARGLDALEDGAPPIGILKAEIEAARLWSVGLVLGEEQVPVGVTWGQPVRIDDERPRVALEHAVAQVDQGRLSLIAGDYMVGYGQRLTLDTTDRTRPDGLYEDLRITPDREGCDSLSVPRSFRGLAVRRAWPLTLGTRMVTDLFVSSKAYDVYFADVTPHDWTSYSDLAYPTFPRAYREDLAGAHVEVQREARARLGLTAWAGRTVRAYDFDFTGVPLPNRTAYGALGLDGSWVRGPDTLGAEAALTDSGGAAGRIEYLRSRGPLDLALAMRAYGAGYDNPHSGAQADADEVSWEEADGVVIPGGDRDRDEVGPQAAVSWRIGRIARLSGRGDLWRRPSLSVTRGSAELRASVDPLDALGFDLAVSVRDKNLAVAGPSQDYEASASADETGGRRSLTVGASSEPVSWVELAVEWRGSSEDNGTAVPLIGSVASAWLTLDPGEHLQLATRARWYDDDLRGDLGDHGASVYADVGYRRSGLGALSARTEWLRDLDAPEEPAEIHVLASLDLTLRPREQR